MPDTYPLLQCIDSPSELRSLREEQLPALSGELRHFLINTVSQSGGHFAAGLGTVELTIALHYVFNTPTDRIVWDVGHQSYPHKILTGRREQMGSIRKSGGLSPFPKRAESPYDTFGVGHAGTSIGAAQGMAEAASRAQAQRHVVAVIGDGAMTAGMAFEALNHAGEQGTNLLVVLNDNEMSISPNVGALSHYLTRILSGKVYATVRKGSQKVLEHIPPIWKIARKAQGHVKNMIVPGTFFEELGFNYFGPIDGHNTQALVNILRNMRTLKGPRLLHVVTKKGKGYLPAEADPVKYHGIGTPFDPATGIVSSHSTPSSLTYTQVFGDWACDMARQDQRLICITPAMREGSGLVRFAYEFPDRYFDVAIAEQHSITLAAGMACEGMKPVVAIYSTFLQRAYDQVIHDVALQNLPVLLAIDRAGLVGEDGPTHAGAFDLGYLRCLPNMVIMVPADENECRQMLYTGFLLDKPCAVRYPRGQGPGVEVESELQAFPIGRAELRRRGEKIAILAFGSTLTPSLHVGERLNATVANMRFVKPLDEAFIAELATQHDLLVTVDENQRAGGAGSAVNEYLADLDPLSTILNIGLPDRFIEHGKRGDMLIDAGLDAEGIERQICQRLKSGNTP